jgi:predicted N-acetyltransferase YhbS
MSSANQPLTATVLSVEISKEVTTVDIVISRAESLAYPIAPACLWRSDSKEVIFSLDQLVARDDRRLRFETYESRLAVPEIGVVYPFTSLWNHWAMDAVRDLSADWQRREYPYEGDHNHCLLTWQTIAGYSEHKEGYVSSHGWVTVEAYKEYIEEDRARIRSGLRSIERRPVELHRVTDMVRTTDGVEQLLRYALESQLTPEEFVDVLRRSTLADRRPVADGKRIAGMLTNADLLVTARLLTGLLVGVSRAITDYHYCTYLSDLAVDLDYQRQGIGRELVRRTHEAAGPSTRLILLAAPASRDYYPHIGMQHHDSCWTIQPR